MRLPNDVVVGWVESSATGILLLPAVVLNADRLVPLAVTVGLRYTKYATALFSVIADRTNRLILIVFPLPEGLRINMKVCSVPAEA